ncbi:FAD:protein FMN transferase [Ruminococcus sp. HUN007]|uniref:FAD:protein FMN transferase n=1 Tax=Ruminococcus sp. HUN007 TaxID=1514668 RepID=UPI000B11D120|nr:FAD:protein FMN transferase [Ruminococcus sp. HUN007]
MSVRSDKNITDAVRKEITSLDAVFDSCSENSEITELNVKKEMVCSSELTDLILKTETLNRTYGYGVDISAGRLTDLWRGAIETGIIPDEEKIDEILKNTENKKNLSIR